MPKPSVTVYGLGHCTTCQKAVAFLEEHGVRVAAYHDVKAKRLSRAQIAKLAKLVGGPEALFSKRAMKYRALGLHERTLTPEEMLDLMTEEYTFITRPVIVPEGGTSATAGFAPKRIKTLLGL